MILGWLFHTSGTTGNHRKTYFRRPASQYFVTGYPKPITYTHKMMAIPDMAANLAGDGETNMHHYAFKRWYTPLPMIHVSSLPSPSKRQIDILMRRIEKFVGMLMVLSMSTFIHDVVVLGPPTPPSTKTIIEILKFGKVDGALLVPAMIE